MAPGIQFACLLNGQGGCTELTEGRTWDWRQDNGLLWIHLERQEPDCRRWLTQMSGLDLMIVDALLAEESRPRVEIYDDSMMVVLRGVNRVEHETPEDLVPIHLWIDKDRVISVRDSGQVLWALRDVREALWAGHGPPTAGALFVQIVEKLVRDMEPLIDDIETEIDALDDSFSATPHTHARRSLSAIRRRATKLRRWILPQREALNRVHYQDMTWLSPREAVRLREVADRLVRYIESLDADRDLAATLHDDLNALRSEQIGRNTHRLMMMATILLPPTLTAGLLSQRLDLILHGGEPWAFGIAIAVELAMMPAIWWLMRRARWL
jgi:zinc transporter